MNCFFRASTVYTRSNEKMELTDRASLVNPANTPTQIKSNLLNYPLI